MSALPRAFICGLAGVQLSAAEDAFLTRTQPLGVILFARNIETPAQVRALIAEVRARLHHPYVQILIDQEGGRVARLKPPHWPAYPAARALTADKPEADAARDVYNNARAIAADLAALGITTNCAPLADVPAPDCHDVIGDRAFSTDVARVARYARSQADGLRDGGIAPVLKHIPGHGRATCDSHLALPRVTADLPTLAATDFAPFRALADLPQAMTAHVVYDALDAEACATQSRIVIDYIRHEIGFSGLLMSDDLSMKALAGDYDARTQATLSAGCDIALHCNGEMDQMAAVAAAAPICGPQTRARLDRVSAYVNANTSQKVVI